MTTPPPEPAPRPADARDRRFGAAALLLLLLLHLFFTNRYAHWRNPNEFSRLYYLLALVDEGTPRIDGYLDRYGDLMDKAAYEGHYYSDKAPGVVLQLLPVGWLLRQALGRDMLPQDFLLFLRLLGLTLPVVGFWWLTHRYWAALAGSARLGWGVVLAVALGTNFFIYATQLFAHVYAGAELFLGFLCIRRAAAGRRPAGTLALSGALCALALTCDYLVALPVAVLTAYAAWAARPAWPRFVCFAAGALLPVLPWMWSNWACFGAPFAIGHQYLADPVYGPYHQQGAVMRGVGWPDPRDLGPIFFGPLRGVLYLSPVLVLAPWGWWRLARVPGRRAEALGCAGVVAALTLFILAVNSPWHGGWSVGVRYFVPAVPFCAVGLARALHGADAGMVRSVLFRGLAVVGLVTMGLSAATFPGHPLDFTSPVYQLALPLFRDGYVGPALLVAHPAVGRAAFGALVLLAAALVLWGAWPTRRGATTALLALALGLGVVGLQYAATPPPTALGRLTLGDVEYFLGYAAAPPAGMPGRPSGVEADGGEG